MGRPRAGQVRGDEARAAQARDVGAERHRVAPEEAPRRHRGREGGPRSARGREDGGGARRRGGGGVSRQGPSADGCGRIRGVLPAAASVLLVVVVDDDDDRPRRRHRRPRRRRRGVGVLPQVRLRRLPRRSHARGVRRDASRDLGLPRTRPVPSGARRVQSPLQARRHHVGPDGQQRTRTGSPRSRRCSPRSACATDRTRE